MLDGILGRGFTSKCKSLIKLTKSRIDVIRRKKRATLKFLKKDIADLLANGLDINAYGRAEGLLVELTISSCYDFVEKSCDIVLNHLQIMQKQRECPEECCEAIASLMFAAARFSDLPELRDLRQIFQERFENSLEHHENQKFVENLATKPSTLEMKVRLLQDIALEFSISWDSKGFEKRMSTPPVYAQGLPKAFGSPNAVVEKTSSRVKETDPKGDPKGTKGDPSCKVNFEHTNGGHRSLNPKDSTISRRKDFNFQPMQELPGNRPETFNDKEVLLTLKIEGHKFLLGEQNSSTVSKPEPRLKEGSAFKPSRVGSSSSSEIPSDSDTRNMHNGRERIYPDHLKFSPNSNAGVAPSGAGLMLKTDVKEPSSGNSNTHNKGLVGVPENAEDKQHKLKPSHNSLLPPPYVKSSSKLKDHKDRNHLELSRRGNDENCISADPRKHVRSEMSAGISQLESCQNHERQSTGPTRANSHREKDDVFGSRLPVDTLPKPRSIRRRHHKSRSSHSVENDEDNGGVRKTSRSRRRDDKRGLQLLVDEEAHGRDEEERIIDNLLIHYSKKASTFEPGKGRRKPKIHLTFENNSKAAECLLTRSRDRPDDQADIVPPPARSISLPREHSGPSKATKVFMRAASFQPDRSNEAKHVHPKLPDYDDLAAQFAALRGR